jgi:hypothetical protein
MQVARYRGGDLEVEEPELAAALQHLDGVPGLQEDPDTDDELAEEAFWDPLPMQQGAGHQEAANGLPQHDIPNLPHDAGAHQPLQGPPAAEAAIADNEQQEVLPGQQQPLPAQEQAPDVAQEQEHNEAQGAPARPGTIEWFREHAAEPVVEGGKPIMVVIFTMLSILSYKNIHKETFDMIMEAVSDLLGPNHWPRCALHCCV